MTFDQFAWWDEGRNSLLSEVKTEMQMIVGEIIGWLEFNRLYGSILTDYEYEANNFILQILAKANMVYSVMEYNNLVSEGRQIALSQADIAILQEDNEFSIDMKFNFMKNLKRDHLKIPVGLG